MGLLESLFHNSDTNWLKTKCPALFDQQGSFNKLPSKYTVNDKITDVYRNTNLENGKNYYNIVESGNEYVENLLEKEEIYMKTKYGKDLYKYFIQQRKDYITKKLESDCTTIINNISDSDSGDSMNINNFILTKEFNTLNETYSLYVSNNKIKEKNKTNKIDSDNLDNRKFSYILTEINAVDNINNILFYCYYFGILCFFIYVSLINKLEFKKNAPVYLAIIIVPFIIKYVFLVLVYIYDTVKSTLFNTTSGPKNAFLNENFM
uniref:Uncharacterized protein n=1 Tax=Florenciella sp. virus SA2 TaxID=3240092 RepID=A0AB39JCT5_9VIRU